MHADNDMEQRKTKMEPRRTNPPAVAYAVQAPTGGVTLDGGLFGRALDANIVYLLENSDLDNMLHRFRQAAGQPAPREAEHWETRYPAHAAQFLMGAGNTLCWVEHPELRDRLDAVVDGLEQCRQPGGHLIVPPVAELKGQWGYNWQMFTHGLIAAHHAGNPRALPLLRATHDRHLAASANQPAGFAVKDDLNYQGHPAGLLMYFSPLGKPADLAAAEQWYVTRDWMKALSARDPDATWKNAPKWPHCYLIIAFEAYLDHYRATGEQECLDAMLGAWELMRDNWVHIGGSIAICEHDQYPPRCYPLTARRHTGELCGSVFWIRFNHRLHQLFPDDERFITEIEKCIYNVALAGQEPGGKGMHYHLLLEGTRNEGGAPWIPEQVPSRLHTCCEGMGTWLYGALPQYIYTVGSDAISVNLFAPSTITARLSGQPVKLAMETEFPFARAVTITVQTDKPVRGSIRVRVPSWADQPVPVAVNDQPAATGHTARYAELNRTWSSGDRISFELPLRTRLTRYIGEDAIPGADRYALEHGPILLACTGELPAYIAHDPAKAAQWLQPVPGQPLRFKVAGHPDREFVPYVQLRDDTTFTCCPIMDQSAQSTR